MENKKDFYTVEEIARMLSLNKNTIYTLIKDKKLKAIKISRKAIRIKREDLDTFLSKLYNS